MLTHTVLAMLIGMAWAQKPPPPHIEMLELGRIMAELPVEPRRVTVAVLGSGVDCGHSDLRERMFLSYTRSFVDQSPCTDELAHETMVAGIACAAPNPTGYDWLLSGVAPTGCEIVSLKTYLAVPTPEGMAAVSSTETLVKALREVAAWPNRLVVINASFVTEDTPEFKAAVAALEGKALIVSAAGNNGNSTMYAPCEYANEMPHVICVGSVMADGTVAGYSNRGPEVTLGAYGWYVLGPVPGGGWASGLGTSFATPQVSGLAVLTVQLAESWGIQLTPAELKTILVKAGKADIRLLGIFGNHRVANGLKIPELLKAMREN